MAHSQSFLSSGRSVVQKIDALMGAEVALSSEGF